MKDIDNVYSGIFSCIISILGDLFYILIVLFFSLNLISIPFSIRALIFNNFFNFNA